MLQQFGDKPKTTLFDFNGEKEFSGVTPVCGDHQVEAHKVFMAAGSSLFKKILTLVHILQFQTCFKCGKLRCF